MASPKLWERQPTDTDKSFAAFSEYLAMPMGKRSLRAMVDEVGKMSARSRHLQKWSSKHNWVARCQAWDDTQTALIRDSVQDERLAQRELRQTLTQDMLKIYQQTVARTLGVKEGKATKPPSAKDLSMLTSSYTRIMDQSRQEYDDMPKQRSELTGKDGKPIQHEHGVTWGSLTERNEDIDGFGTIEPDTD